MHIHLLAFKKWILMQLKLRSGSAGTNVVLVLFSLLLEKLCGFKSDASLCRSYTKRIKSFVSCQNLRENLVVSYSQTSNTTNCSASFEPQILNKAYYPRPHLRNLKLMSIKQQVAESLLICLCISHSGLIYVEPFCTKLNGVLVYEQILVDLFVFTGIILN